MSASLTSGKSVSAPAEIEIQLTGSYNHSHHHHRDSDDKPKSALVKDEKTKREATLMDFGTNFYQQPFEIHNFERFLVIVFSYKQNRRGCTWQHSLGVNEVSERARLTILFLIILVFACRQLPRQYLYISGSLVQLAAAGIFILFFMQQYNSNIGAKFISLESNAGYCQQVSLDFSGWLKLIYCASAALFK
jgi:hypothetical protein